MFAEDELLPLSALSHFVFCERRAALIHLERQWAENVYTVEGAHLHQVAHDVAGETRGSVRISRGVPLRSLRLGLAGVADVIEWHRLRDGPDASAGALLPGIPGRWRPFPVEYKLGKPKPDLSDEVQICGQALCIEEMTGSSVLEGALFYGRTRRRHEVLFDSNLRHETIDYAHRLHSLMASRQTPRAVFEKKCERCSLVEICCPEIAGKSVRRYLSAALRPPAGSRPL